MFPIILDTTKTRIVLIGNGPHADRRRTQLAEANTHDFRTFKTRPDDPELKRAHIVYVVDMPEGEAALIAAQCREYGTLVNVEDVPDLCDFHTPAIVRRGDLLLSVSTGGKSPGLAQKIRAQLETLFGAEWAQRLDILAEKRMQWRAEGQSMDMVAANTGDYIEKERWLG